MANSDWTEYSLGELIDIRHGFAFDGQYFRDEPPGNMLLTPGNFAIGGGFQRGRPKYYSGPIPNSFVLAEGDLLVTMTDLSKSGDTLGYPALVPAARDEIRYLHNQRLGKVTVRPGMPVELNYLYYLLRTKDYRDEVLSSATGSTVRHTSPDRIRAFRFLLPPLPEQRAIARILGALDDKIELNRRMNATLEGIARALFQSWFVDFDPVRAKAAGRQPEGMDAATAALFPDAFEESRLGPVPRGWRAMSFSDVFEINPSRSLRAGQTAPYVEMGNLPTTSARVLDWESRSFGSGMRFENGDVLVARITPCLENGKTAYVDFLADGEVGWGSTEYIVVRSKPPLPLQYAYFLSRSEDFRSYMIANMTGTSGRQRVPVDCLNSFHVVMPLETIAKRFGGITDQVVATMRSHDQESRTLAALRDALLPKLLSGAVRAGEAEAMVEASK